MGGGPRPGRPLEQSQLRGRTGCSVVAIRRREELLANPDPSIGPEAGDELILAGSEDAEKRFMEEFLPPG